MSIFLFFELLIFIMPSCGGPRNLNNKVGKKVVVPAGPNSWLMDNTHPTNTITVNGIRNWTNKSEQFETYVLVGKQGEFRITMNASQTIGTAIISVSVLGKTKNISIHGNNMRDYNIGSFHIDSAQYIHIHLKAIKSTNNSYPDINSYTFFTKDSTQKFHFITLQQDQPMIWARRGPSTHISFKFPVNMRASALYTELTVPVGSDKPGSFFMANGFPGGYFGIQNSADSVKQVLFSVWTTKKYTDWSNVPDSEQTTTSKIGMGVKMRHFHDGGTGNAYSLQYNWIPGNTYKFLVKCYVDTMKDITTYTAWFYAPEKKKWILMASVKKPLYTEYFTRLSSFLECFVTSTGNMERDAYYGSQWILDLNGKWIPLESATLDGIQNERKNRYDYNHGVKNNQYFLSGFGFIYSGSPATGLYKCTLTSAPDIDFNSLPLP